MISTWRSRAVRPTAVSRRISAQRRSISIVKCRIQSFSASRAAGTVDLHPGALQELIATKTSKTDFCIPSNQNPVARSPEQRIRHCRLRLLTNPGNFLQNRTRGDTGQAILCARLAKQKPGRFRQASPEGRDGGKFAQLKTR